MDVRLLPETVADLRSAIDWFNRLSAGLGEDFESEFYAAFDRIKSNPEIFAIEATGYRACRMRRFTGVIYFRLSLNRVIVVGLMVNGRDERQIADRE